jgi:excisionase family DNA binding protein
VPYLDYSGITIDDLADRNFALVPEYAAIMECDPRTVLADIRRGAVPATKVGRQFRIPMTWLRAAVAGRLVGGAA